MPERIEYTENDSFRQRAHINEKGQVTQIESFDLSPTKPLGSAYYHYNTQGRLIAVDSRERQGVILEYIYRGLTGDSPPYAIEITYSANKVAGASLWIPPEPWVDNFEIIRNSDGTFLERPLMLNAWEIDCYPDEQTGQLSWVRKGKAIFHRSGTMLEEPVSVWQQIPPLTLARIDLIVPPRPQIIK